MSSSASASAGAVSCAMMALALFFVPARLWESRATQLSNVYRECTYMHVIRVDSGAEVGSSRCASKLAILTCSAAGTFRKADVTFSHVPTRGVKDYPGSHLQRSSFYTSCTKSSMQG
jgi:hypothetical protein